MSELQSKVDIFVEKYLGYNFSGPVCDKTEPRVRRALQTMQENPEAGDFFIMDLSIRGNVDGLPEEAEIQALLSEMDLTNQEVYVKSHIPGYHSGYGVTNVTARIGGILFGANDRGMLFRPLVEQDASFHNLFTQRLKEATTRREGKLPRWPEDRSPYQAPIPSE